MMDQAVLLALARKHGLCNETDADSTNAQATFTFDLESLAALMADVRRSEGWRAVAEQLPHPMSGYVAVLHPQVEEPRLEFVGTHPRDFREDGYTHFFPIPSVPEAHRADRRLARRRANLKIEDQTGH
ncbi:hypothetical protein F6X40_24150 [Paraburkholderia sp. UCT31]|uniref:hypothetical protein n=1 Tax=Paraburkholderia sp. UCT31 TaxID=2615209 RepID=UPI0016552FAB|nr:hypothetical protein [Paraburkholderia sp. UCT31]MBC8739810.1 hypothetical protein [Paraburkholderia sp. UCT31]